MTNAVQTMLAAAVQHDREHPEADRLIQEMIRGENVMEADFHDHDGWVDMAVDMADLRGKNNTLEARNAELEARIAELEARIAKLENNEIVRSHQVENLQRLLDAAREKSP